MHAAQSSPQRLHGLGVLGADSGPYPRMSQGSPGGGGYGMPSTPPRNSPYRGSGPAVSPSPQRTAPTPLRGSPSRTQANVGYLPPSPTLGHGRGGNGSPANSPSKQRFRIANPDPTPQQQQQQQQQPPQAQPPQEQKQQQQPQGGNSFALRPTHSFNPRNQFTATSFSSIPPPGQTQSPFAPAASSPLKPLVNYENRVAHSTEAMVDTGHGNGTQIRPSKSSEILRKLTGNENKNSYQPISDDDYDEAEDERIRLPLDSSRSGAPSAVRSSSGAAKSLAPPVLSSTSSSWTQSKEHLVSDFPAPPSLSFPYAERRSTESLDNNTPQTSEETFTTATQDAQGFSTSNDSFASTNTTPKANRRKSMPYPASAAPNSDKRMSLGGGDGYPARHSRDEALLAAETGGMIRLSNDGYTPGDSPGMAVSRYVPGTRSGLSGSPSLPREAPDYPPIPRPPSNRHSTASDSRFDFSRPRSGPTPQSTPHSTPSAEEATATWATDNAGPRRRHGRSNSDGVALLARHGTLFHPASSTERASQELDVMLGKPRSRRLSANALLPLPEAPKDKVRLEASKKSRARVELSVIMEREAVVEGGELRGRVEIVVHGGKRGHGLRVGAGKLRVVGYEEVGGNAGTRHIFYQHQYPLPVFQNHDDSPHTSLFADGADEEGFHLAVEGTHAIPFSCPLPVGGGAKGAFTSTNPKGPNVRYVVVGSVKLHIPKTGKRAIAHFYRPLVLLPYHNPAVALAPALEPVVDYVENGLGWSIGGEKGKVFMQVALGRRIWVAGQRVWCEIGARNDSNKKITKCALAILQNVNTFGGHKGAKCKSGGAFESTERRKVAEEITEADFMDVGSGHVTGKSWWTGLEPGEASRWDMSVAIPTGMLSISRSRYVEVNYVLRVTLNGTIYVDVPIELISFLSIDPPPMPSDTRHMRGRLPVKTQVQVPYQQPQQQLNQAPEPPMASQPRLIAPLANEPQQRQVAPPRQQPAAASPIVSNPYEASVEPMVAPEPFSRSDASPTLGDNNISMGYTMEQLQIAPETNMSSRHSSTTLNLDGLLAEGRERAAQEAAADVPEDLNPRPPSPGSQYSTQQGGGTYLTVPSTSSRNLRHKVSQEFSDVQSIDDEERNYLSMEEHRREGREKVLASLQQADNDATEDLDDASEDSHGLDPEDQRVFAPESEPVGDAFELDRATEDGSVVSESDNERTPVVSPVTSPAVPARAAFLHHISEEEEPLDDDTFDEMMSSDGHGSQLHYLSGDKIEDDDDLLAAQDASDTTPRVSRYDTSEMPGRGSMDDEAQSRPSLEDRLARACSSTPGPGGMAAGAALIGAATASSNIHGREEVVSPQSVDYNEPLDIDELSVAGHDAGYDADAVSEKDSTFGHASTFPRHAHSLSLPGGMSQRRGAPPSLPSSGSSRDISWGVPLSGRTVSGHTANLNFDDETPVATPTSATFGTAPHSPRHYDEVKQQQGGSRSLAALYADEMSSMRAPDRSILGATGSPNSKGSSSGRSYHTAEGQDVPPLARSGASDESVSSDGVESPPTVSQPVYSSPLPVPPSALPQHSPNVPQRFRPPPAMSEESHDSYGGSTVSTAHSELLPSVKARAQQFETREEALRKFTVAGSAAMHSPSRSEFSIAPLSPAHTGASSQRRSYTSALAPRPTTPSRAAVTKSVSSPLSPAFGLELRTPRDALQEFSRRQEDEEYAAPEANQELSGSAARLLSRALSTTSTSTTATDIERSLASPMRSPLLGPRGPRQPRPRDRDITPTQESIQTHETQWTRDSLADFSPPHAAAAAELDSSSLRRSPAHTLQKASMSLPVPEVSSQRASLEDMPNQSPPLSADTHETQSVFSGEGDESVGSASDFGSTGWTGGMRLPAVRLPVQKRAQEVLR